MDVSVVMFVSQCAPEVFSQCLECIAKSEGVSWELIVIDDMGDAQTLTRVSRVIPRSTVIITRERKGFAVTANQGLARVKGRYVFLLDAHVFLTPGMLADIVADMDVAPHVGASGSVVHWMASLRIFNILRRNEWRKAYRMRRADFLCIRRAAFEKVGNIDTRYFSWFGAIDYCKMVVDAGMQVQYAACVGTSVRKTEKFSPSAYVREEGCLRKDLRTYFWKHEGFFAWLALWLFAPVFLVFMYSEVIIFAFRKKFL